MVKALFDTNILIDYLNGVPEGAAELDLYEQTFISAITWMEVMIGTNDRTEAGTRVFLSRFSVIQVDQVLSEEAVKLRKTLGIKLPDAIIYATANVHNCLLITRNTKDFDETNPSIRVPYRR